MGPEPCPKSYLHTQQPDEYCSWHAWADEMAKTHDQIQCPECGRWAIWVRKKRKTKQEKGTKA